jgi:predicted Fe-S protein YdhL (DUF1289 family)
MSSTLSPCNRLCTVDPLHGLCVGCGRSLAEIGRWVSLSDAERREIMTALPERLAALRARPVLAEARP